MSAKKFLKSSLIAAMISVSAGCATPQNLANVPQEFVSQASTQKISKNDAGPEAPKIRLKIKKAEIEITEQDLNVQFKSVLELSNEKRLQETKLTILANSTVKVEGIIVQKLPLITKPLRLPFIVEGPLSVLPKNVIRFEASKVKVASIPVKTLMDVMGLELANFTKFKDSIGRIELSGNSFLLIVEKFTNDAIIDGQMKSLQSGDKSLTVIF